MANEQNLKSFKKGQSGNPKGRPRKGASLILHTLKELGLSNMNRSQVEDIYMQMSQLTQTELRKIFEDKTQPVISQIVAKSLTGNNNFDVLEKMLDRGIGKPVQRQESKIVGEIEITDKQQKIVNDLIKKRNGKS